MGELGELSIEIFATLVVLDFSLRGTQSCDMSTDITVLSMTLIRIQYMEEYYLMLCICANAL